MKKHQPFKAKSGSNLLNEMLLSNINTRSQSALLQHLSNCNNQGIT